LPDDGFIKGLMTSVKCGVCGQPFELGSVDVLGHHEDLWLLGTVCSACNTRCVMAAVVKKNRVPEIITDLKEAELDKFGNVGAITADEMLDMSNFLRDFSGDFARLFNQK
jgi:hypothetical protein